MTLSNESIKYTEITNPTEKFENDWTCLRVEENQTQETCKEASTGNEEGIELIPLSDITRKEQQFLFYPYILQGKITIVQGDTGVGKTALMCKIAAETSIGGNILESKCEKPGNVLLLSMEDEPNIFYDRIEADGGDLKKCFIPKLNENDILTFQSEEIEQMLQNTSFSLVIFDPFQAFFTGDMNRANETHRALARINMLAEKYDLAVVIVTHISKSSAGCKAIYRTLGSIDIMGSCRSALYVGENPNGINEKIICHIKHNTTLKGESIAYAIGEKGSVKWIGYSSLNENDLDIPYSKENQHEESPLTYDEEPVVIAVRKLLSENPNGLFIPYQDFAEYICIITDTTKYSNTRLLSKKLEELYDDFKNNDQLIILPQKQRCKKYVFLGKEKNPTHSYGVNGITIKPNNSSTYSQPTIFDEATG